MQEFARGSKNSARAMLLAAGRGERMRPLTDDCPKPLLQLRGKPLMQWLMESLVKGGVSELVVNTAWCGEAVSHCFGAHFALPSRSSAPLAAMPDNSPGLHISYSHEGRDFGGALETAGGIVRALPQLGPVFWLLAGDVHAPDFQFSQAAVRRFAASDKLAHLWLVPNPSHHPLGDFGLSPEVPGGSAAGQVALNRAEVQYTYSTIGLYRRELFSPPYCDIPPGNPQGLRAKLVPILRAAIDDAQVTAELYTGEWTDVGTPERLAQLNRPHTT